MFYQRSSQRDGKVTKPAKCRATFLQRVCLRFTSHEANTAKEFSLGQMWDGVQSKWNLREGREFGVRYCRPCAHSVYHRSCPPKLLYEKDFRRVREGEVK